MSILIFCSFVAYDVGVGVGSLSQWQNLRAGSWGDAQGTETLVGGKQGAGARVVEDTILSHGDWGREVLLCGTSTLGSLCCVLHIIQFLTFWEGDCHFLMSPCGMPPAHPSVIPFLGKSNYSSLGLCRTVTVASDVSISYYTDQTSPERVRACSS